MPLLRLLQDCSTPLHCASWNGHPEVVAQLLAAGADMGVSTKLVRPPL
jgi:ankyrin repeat protein